MSSPGSTPTFDDDAIDLLHHRWSARSARFHALVTGPAVVAVPDMAAPAEAAGPTVAVAS